MINVPRLGPWEVLVRMGWATISTGSSGRSRMPELCSSRSPPVTRGPPGRRYSARVPGTARRWPRRQSKDLAYAMPPSRSRNIIRFSLPPEKVSSMRLDFRYSGSRFRMNS